MNLGDKVTVTGTVLEMFADTVIIELDTGGLAPVPTSALRVVDGDSL